MCPMYRCRFDELFTDVHYWGELCVVQVGFGLGGGTALKFRVFVLHDLQSRPEGNSSKRE